MFGLMPDCNWMKTAVEVMIRDSKPKYKYGEFDYLGKTWILVKNYDEAKRLGLDIIYSVGDNQ